MRINDDGLSCVPAQIGGGPSRNRPASVVSTGVYLRGRACVSLCAWPCTSDILTPHIFWVVVCRTKRSRWGSARTWSWTSRCWTSPRTPSTVFRLHQQCVCTVPCHSPSSIPPPSAFPPPPFFLSWLNCDVVLVDSGVLTVE